MNGQGSWLTEETVEVQGDPDNEQVFTAEECDAMVQRLQDERLKPGMITSIKHVNNAKRRDAASLSPLWLKAGASGGPPGIVCGQQLSWLFCLPEVQLYESAGLMSVVE